LDKSLIGKHHKSEKSLIGKHHIENTMSCGETYGVFELVKITTQSPQVLPPV